jgi:broad specificity phosphatase PhoE
MAPPQGCTTEASSENESTERERSIFIIRHGDRWDYAHPEWKETAERKGDPSLSTLGHRQAREVGQYLDQLFVKEGITAEDVTLVSSPFLRCVQTSNELLSEFQHCKGDVAENVSIKPEYSVFEFDLWDDGLHSSLPTMKERKNYFPRLDESNQSTLIPSVPEDVPTFLKRCEDAIVHLEKVYDSTPILIVVTHAACCIGLAKAATNTTLQEVNAAAPCSIYRLTMKQNSKWEMDHFSDENGLNGYSNHLSDLGNNTFPWNHFERNAENKGVIGAGYTGPPKK